jgi:DNA-binding response OmpR family regulator
MACILIADDDELVAELVSDLLIDAGHACGWVTSAAAAWDCVLRKRPDLLLLDQGMPGESGMTLLRRIRHNPQFHDLPVMMFTALRGEDDRARALYAGAQDFFSKPFIPVELVRRVTRLIALRASRPRHFALKNAAILAPRRAAVPAPLARRVI